MNNTNFTLVVEIDGYGTFKATAAAVNEYEQIAKRNLAHRIAEGYGGGCGKASTASYWAKYPKSVLVVVASDMFRS